MTPRCTTQIQEVRAQLPGPALGACCRRCGSRRSEYGWLSPEALREVADALDLTPAYCQSVASFYDMFHLEPVGRAPGRGLHERLVRARRRAAGARGVRGGARLPRRRDDRGRRGDAARRSSASAAAAGRPSSRSTTATATHVKPDDVPAIVEELRADGLTCRRSSSADADERDLTKLAEYEAVGGYEALAKARAHDAGRGDRGAARRRSCAAAAARSSRPAASGASSRSRSRSRSRTTSSSTPTSRSRAASRTTRSSRASRTASSRAA